MEVDRHKVLQILINLVTNAKHAVNDAHAKTKTITLSVKVAGLHVEFVVKDTGVGIAAENLAKIFGHGFTTRADGHGFGLHMGALSARELGGTLKVASEGLGQGASFTLQLPLPPAQALAA
jgi:signal transduction histidine kinase